MLTQDKHVPAAFWLSGLSGGGLALASGFLCFSPLGVLGVALGVACALLHLFLLKRTALQALAYGVGGKGLFFMVMLKFYIRFLLTALVLAILVYLGWLDPLGFVVGFAAVMLAVLAWGFGRTLMRGRGSL